MINRLLYDEQRDTIDTYSYDINSGGELSVSEHGIVTIIFKNKKFYTANYPMEGMLSRNGWRIMAAINEKIEAIEES